MTDLATLQVDDLERLAAPTVEVMEALIERLADAPAEEAMTVAHRAHLAQEYIRIHRASGELHRSALRLEATALRRLAMLIDDRPEGMHPEVWAAARLFAENPLPRVLAWIENAKSVIALKRQLAPPRKDYDSELITRPPTVAEARNAARALVEAASADEFSIQELADRLVDEPTSLESRALAGLVRDAINRTAPDAPGMDGLPRWIAVKRDDTWVRVNTVDATLYELHQFVEYRRSQAENLMSRVEMMEDAVVRLTARAKRLRVPVEMIRDYQPFKEATDEDR